MLWCAPTTSRAQPHELIQEFLNYSGIQVRSIRFDNAMEFGQSDHFKSWAKDKGAVLCPTVNYNHTLNSKSECYVRITKEYLCCMFLSSNAPRRLWPFALQHFCRIFEWWPNHAAAVHDAPSHAASIERRLQVDSSNVIGDANALQGQTRARTHHSPQFAAAASPASATQIYAAPSVLTRKDYQVGLSACMYQLTPDWNYCQISN